MKVKFSPASCHDSILNTTVAIAIAIAIAVAVAMSLAQPAPLGAPFPEATYTDLSAVKADLQAYARENGFGISVDSSSNHRVFYRCAKGGKYDNRHKDSSVHESRQRNNTSTMKTGCQYRVVARNQAQEQGVGWKTTVLENNHNHGPVVTPAALPQHRIASMTAEEKSQIKQMNSENHGAKEILLAIRNMNPQTALIPRDIYNILASLRVEELDGQTPIEWLLKVLL
jgi:hypothetical protein